MEPQKYSAWVLERLGIGEVFRLREGKNTIGRMPTCSIKVNSSFSSRSHCQFIVKTDGRIYLEDFSSNGTFVNNELYIKSTLALSDGDRIGIGCNVTDEQCEDDIYVMYMLRKRPQVRSAASLKNPPAPSRPVPLHSNNKVCKNEPKEALNIIEEETVKPSTATIASRISEEHVVNDNETKLRRVDKSENEDDQCEFDESNTSNPLKKDYVSTEKDLGTNENQKGCEPNNTDGLSTKIKGSGSTMETKEMKKTPSISDIIELSSDEEWGDSVSKNMKVEKSAPADNTTAAGTLSLFDQIKNPEKIGSEITKCAEKRKSSVSSNKQCKRRKSSSVNEKLIEKPSGDSSSNTELKKRISQNEVHPQSSKKRRKSHAPEIPQSTDSGKKDKNGLHSSKSSSSKEIVTENRRKSSSEKRRPSNSDKSPPMNSTISHTKEKPEKSKDLNLGGDRRKSLAATSTDSSKIINDGAKYSKPIERQQSSEQQQKHKNNDQLPGNEIGENKKPQLQVADGDLDELVEFIDTIDIKQEPYEPDNEIYEISDDEEMNLHISQSFIRDIKKEYVDLELEEEVNTAALPDTEEGDTNKKSVSESDNVEVFNKIESPMFEDEDDSDDDYNDTVTSWVLKLSQSVLSDSKVDLRDDSAFDSLVKNKVDKIPEEIEDKNDFKSVDRDEAWEKHKSLPVNASAKKMQKARPAMPELIEPPSLPTKKGKLRGVSALSAPHTPRKDLIKRADQIRYKEKIAELVKDRKNKWHQKPNTEKSKEKAKSRKFQEERKLKLKELADAQANKRRLNDDDDDDVKIVKTPKVKVTHKNRGAFLAEEHSPEKPMPATVHDKIKLGRIPKRRLSEYERESNDNIKKSILDESAEYKLSKVSTSLIDDISLHNKVSTITALKIKKRTARTSSTVLHHEEKIIVETAISKESQSDNTLNLPECEPIDTIQNEERPVLMESSSNNASLKSILKPLNNLKTNVRHQKKIRFKENHEIRYFQIEDDSSLGRKVDTKDVAVDLTPFVEKTPLYRRKILPIVDHTEMTLSDMLSWKPRWLDTRTEEVNGSGHVLLPMLQQFLTFDDFSKVVFPLMKLEVWAMIEKEYQFKMNSPSIIFKIESRHVENRHGKQRMVFYIECCMNIKTAPLYNGEFGEAKLEFQKSGLRLFAIITNIRKSNANSKYYQITVETSYNVANKDTYENAKEIRFRPITQINVELGAFNAVHHLKQSPLSKLILNPMELANMEPPAIDKVRYKGCDQLNDNQKEALLKAYCRIIDRTVSNVCLIEGPPGTGKSRLISNLAMQILYGDKARCLDRKILICAQSNAAIDVIALKLLEIRGKMDRDKFKLVRFGILERMHKQVQRISVQKLIEGNLKPKLMEDRRNALDQEKELLKAQITALNMTKNVNSVQHDELIRLRQKLDMIERIKNQQLPKEEEKNLYPKYLQGAHIVCTTLSSCIKLLQHTNYFDICIIDEATQCSEPWSLIPLQFGISSLVLVGDTQQLPATVLSKKTDQYGFGTSLFTRIQRCLENTKAKPVLSLRTQYRMNPEICQWPNSYFYKNFLLNGECTTAYNPVIKPYSILNLEFEQNQNVANGQILNTLEASFITDLLVNMFKKLSPRHFSYGIITPYSDHRGKLIQTCSEKGIKEVQISTIDSYQGKEKDVIIISNGRTKGIGFLTNSQRLNVALTRARKCLILCGNFNNLERVPAWKSLLNDAKRRNIFYHINKSDALDVAHKVMPQITVETKLT